MCVVYSATEREREVCWMCRISSGIIPDRSSFHTSSLSLSLKGTHGATSSSLLLLPSPAAAAADPWSISTWFKYPQRTLCELCIETTDLIYISIQGVVYRTLFAFFPPFIYIQHRVEGKCVYIYKVNIEPLLVQMIQVKPVFSSLMPGDDFQYPNSYLTPTR